MISTIRETTRARPFTTPSSAAFHSCPIRAHSWTLLAFLLLVGCVAGGCKKRSANDEEVIVYCSVDEPYASQVFAAFEKETGIHVAPQYDIESSKSVGLAGKLEAEQQHPRCDVWWCSEAFLSVRLANEKVLQPYVSPAASDIPALFKDAAGYWAGCGLRARVLAIGATPPPFPITGLKDLADPRLKGQCCMARPTAGATGAHVAALYATWGPEKSQAFFRQLRANDVKLMGGNAEVANQVGHGSYALGLTDSDDVANAINDGGKLSQVVPDQGPDGMGTLAMPTTVALVAGSQHTTNSKKLIDYLLSPKTEQILLNAKFVKWSVRGGGDAAIKAMPVDYKKAAEVYARAQREATAILDGREP